MVVPALGDGRFEPARPGFFGRITAECLGKFVRGVSGVVANKNAGRLCRWGGRGSVFMQTVWMQSRPGFCGRTLFVLAARCRHKSSYQTLSVYLVFECSFAAYASLGQQKRPCFCPCNLTASPRTIFRMPSEALFRHPISHVMIADLAACKTLAGTKPTRQKPSPP